jgi:D-sedoheptulose 7-phosphate isomerase
MASVAASLSAFVAERLHARNAASRVFFDREADRLASACRQMAERFRRGGRLLAFGRGAMATDAQHAAVEFVHPVIVGKRALPALDLSPAFERFVPALTREMDIVMGFSAPEEDHVVTSYLDLAATLGALTFALPGPRGHFAIEPPSREPYISQELIEVLYHTLWETVHVFLEHRDRGHDDVGASAFLYPFLGAGEPDFSNLARDVAASIRAKAAEDERLRDGVARDQSGQIAEAVAAVRVRLEAGATLMMFGNGGSATDANDWAIDCVSPPPDAAAIRALSLSADPAAVTAVANDVGVDAVFLRQLIAYGRRGDVAVAISTSGSSVNLMSALAEARSRGMLTMALLGGDGGEIARRGLADVAVVVNSDYIPRIQEVQASIYHVMTEAWRA